MSYLFRAVANLVIPSLMGDLLLYVGQYPSGQSAIAVQSSRGEPLFTLTHNMTPEQMEHAEVQDGFWVKVNEPSDIRTAALAALLQSGLFAPSDPPEYVGAGMVERYAQLWRFRSCNDPTHHDVGRPAALCSACLLAVRTGRFQPEQVQAEFHAAGVVIDPSVNYASLLIEDSISPLVPFGSGLVCPPEEPAPPEGYEPPQPSCLVEQDAPTEPVDWTPAPGGNPDPEPVCASPPSEPDSASSSEDNTGGSCSDGGD